MSDSRGYRLGADVPDSEALHDSQGRVVDDGYVDTAVAEALTRVRGRGRPSLSGSGSGSGESPLLQVRLSRELDLAIRRAADGAGASRSEWVRKVLDEATRRAS